MAAIDGIVGITMSTVAEQRLVVCYMNLSAIAVSE
jgi:hypothetical protein